jgi:hypothetical protein
MIQFNQLLGALTIPLVIIGYIFFWCGLMIVIGGYGGWALLAQKYRTTSQFEGSRWHFQSAQFRWSCNYSGGLTVGANATGIYLRMPLPFRPGHPTLFIPWAETKVEMKKSFWSSKFMEVQFPEVPGTYVRFSKKLADRIASTAFQQSA